MYEDPFFSLKDEVQTNLTSVTLLFNNWLVTLNEPDTSAAGESFKSDTGAIKETLLDIQEDLTALEETIKIVEGNPSKFHLDHSEISERKTFVSKIRREVQSMQQTLLNPNASKKADLDRQLLLGKRTQTMEQNRPEDQISNSRFIEREQQQQQLLMRQQDQQMDDVALTIGNIKEIANVMGRELDDQTHLLKDLDVQVDSTAGKLQIGMRRVQDFIKANSDTKQQWTICVLIVILIILIVMVIYL